MGIANPNAFRKVFNFVDHPLSPFTLNTQCVSISFLNFFFHFEWKFMLNYFLLCFNSFQAVMMRLSNMRNEIVSRQTSTLEEFPHQMVVHSPVLWAGNKLFKFFLYRSHWLLSSSSSISVSLTLFSVVIDVSIKVIEIWFYSFWGAANIAETRGSWKLCKGN